MRKSFTRFLSLLFVFCLVSISTIVNAATQKTVKLYAEDVSACYNASNEYNVKVSMMDFISLDRFNLVLNYSEGVFNYVGPTSLASGPLAGMTITNDAVNGTLTFAWTTATTPVTFADNLKTDVVTLNFAVNNFPNNLANSYVSPMTWTTSNFFYKFDSSSTEVVNTAAITNGSLNVTVGITGVQVAVGTVSCAGGDAVGTVTSPAQGTGYMYLFNEDPNPVNWTWSANASYEAPAGSTNTVRVKDANGCISLPATFSVANLAPVTYTASKQDATCKGGNGELQITAVGGTGPYTYWVIPDANFASVQPTLTTNAAKIAASSDYKKINFQILRPAGDYWVAVDDVNMCRDLSNAGYWTKLTIAEPATSVAVALGTILGETCANSNNGSVTVSVSGGTAAGEYKVSTNGGLTWFTTVEGSYTFTNLAPGTYNVTAMDDNGCKALSANAVVAATAPITFDLSIVDTSCGGNNDGQITVANIAGGTSPYTLTIQNEVGPTTQTGVLAAGYTFTGLSPKYYSLTITDTNGCVVAYSNPNGSGNVIAVQSPSDINFSVAETDVACNGGNGTLTVTATGGSGSYLYGLNGVYATPNTNVFSVPAGTYSVSVKNASGTGCEVPLSEIGVNQPNVLVASIDHVLPPTCVDGSDGNIYVNIAGGTAPYSYSINNGSWVVANGSLAIIKATVGTQTINIKDANGCSIAAPLVQTVTQNQDVIIATSSKVITCFGDANDAVINVSVSSWAADLMGSPSSRIIQYKYSTSAATANTGTGFTPGLTTFPAGTYWIGAVDEFGCMATPVQVIVSQNPQLVISSVVANGASCAGTFGGTITIQTTGGTLNSGQKLQYALLNSQAGLDNITPDKWLSFQTYDPVTTLSTVSFQVEKGDYWIAVKDGNCVNNLVTYGPITVIGYDKLAVDETKIVAVNANCNGDLNGSITVPMTAVSGGAGAYMFTLLDVNGVKMTNRIQQATGSFQNLGAGTYSVLVEDSQNCPSYTTAPITITQPAVLSFTTAKTYFTCNNSNDGMITITVPSGAGTAPYYYAINNVNTWVAFDGNSKTYVATEPGTFSIWVKDAHGCVAGPTAVEIDQPTAIVPVVTVVNNVLCNGGSTGKITVTATGGWSGMSVYSYSVDNGAWGNAASIAALNLSAGNHTLYVKDIASYSNPYPTPSVGCVYSVPFTITQPLAIAYNVAITDVKCKGGNDGTLTVTVDGTTGTPFYSNDNNPANDGYLVQVTGNGFNQTAMTGADNVITFTGLAPSFYTVHISDSNGCTLQPTVGNTVAPYTTIESWKVSEPDQALTIAGEWVKDASCFGSTDGQFTINATGGSGSYQYYAALSIEPSGHILVPEPPVAGSNEWQSSNVFNVGAGTWVIWTIDSNGCMIGGETLNGAPYNPWRVKIGQPNQITWNFVMKGSVPDTIFYQMPSCFGKEDGQIYLTNVAGGNGQFSAVVTGKAADGTAKVYTQAITQSTTAPFYWIINNVAATDANGYTVKVIDSNGCESVTQQVVINQPKLLAVTLAKGADQFTCPDAVEGFIEATATGGTAPYTYSLYKDGVLHTADVTPSAFLVQIGHTFMVEVKDANGCTADASITINPVLPVVATLSETTCYSDAAASVVVSATGEPGRTFSVRYRLNTSATYTAWMPMDSNNSLSITGLIFADNTPTQNFYYFQVEDSQGCMTSDISKSFVATQHPLQATVVQSTDQLSATLTITGGVSPYSYKVGSAALINLPVDGNTFQVVNLQAGATVVTVYDAHGCNVAESLNVDPLAVTAVPASGNNMEQTFNVALTFNRDVVVPVGGITVTGGVGTVTGSGKAYTVAVSAADLSSINIVLANTIVDAAGNMFAGKTFTYTVGDHVAPTVTVTPPATPVPTYFTVGLKFSEPVAGVLNAVTVTGGKLEDVSGLGDTYTVKVSALEQTAVTIVISNAITDLSANANQFAGLTLNYTTGDFTKPQILTMDPSDGTTTTDNHPTFTMSFSENVAVGTGGSLKVYKVNTTTAILDIPITASMINGSNVTVSYAATQTGLDKNTRYYVLVDATALQDLAGNTFDGVTDPAAWTFKTGADFATVIDPTQNGSLEFKVYPNPFDNDVNIINGHKLSKIVVTNIAGQVVKEVVNPTDNIKLNELRSGVYFISMYKSNNVIAQTAKIVKR